MKIHTQVSVVVLVGALALTHPAHSETISIKGHSPSQVKGNSIENSSVLIVFEEASGSKIGVFWLAISMPSACPGGFDGRVASQHQRRGAPRSRTR